MERRPRGWLETADISGWEGGALPLLPHVEAAMNPDPEHPLRLFIRKLDGIAALGADARQAIEQLPITVRTLTSRHDIVQLGDRPSQCCLILAGWACRYMLLDQGRRQILSFHMPGDIPDLLSLHLGVMDHSLCTVGPATVAFVSHKSVRELTARFPALAAMLWRETLVDASTFRGWMVGIGRRSATERVAHLFCELYVRQQALQLASDWRCSVPFTQTDLADALGLTNVHVNRVIRDLRKDGLATLRTGELVIHKWQELVALAEFDAVYLHLNAHETPAEV